MANFQYTIDHKKRLAIKPVFIICMIKILRGYPKVN